LTNLLLYNYYYRSKSKRNTIKNVLESDDIINAQILLDEEINTHDNYISSNNIVDDGESFTSVDNRALHHAKRHLDAFQISGQIQQKEATARALDEQY
jgi:hypothetical protein